MATPSNQACQAPTAAAGVLVILGASGDLTKRLLMPAVYNLACEGSCLMSSPSSAWR